MLDPEFGDTIEDFHDEAAKQFASLAEHYGSDGEPPVDGVAEEVQVSEEVIESGSAPHGGGDAESVSENEG